MRTASFSDIFSVPTGSFKLQRTEYYLFHLIHYSSFTIHSYIIMYTWPTIGGLGSIYCINLMRVDNLITILSVKKVADIFIFMPQPKLSSSQGKASFAIEMIEYGHDNRFRVPTPPPPPTAK